MSLAPRQPGSARDRPVVSRAGSRCPPPLEMGQIWSQRKSCAFEPGTGTSETASRNSAAARRSGQLVAALVGPGDDDHPLPAFQPEVVRDNGAALGGELGGQRQVEHPVAVNRFRIPNHGRVPDLSASLSRPTYCRSDRLELSLRDRNYA